MAVLVPINPEKKPAIPMRAGVGLIRTGSRLTSTAIMTVKPNHKDSVRASIHTSKNPPANIMQVLMAMH